MEAAAPEFLAELKVPADPGFIPAAKRVGASIGSTLGFSIEEIDELGIAIAQACDSTIEACEEIWGKGSGAMLKLSYGRTDKGISVEVEATGPSAAQAHTKAIARRRQAMEAARHNAEMQRMAQEMIRFFVDDFRSSVVPSRGQVRFRMVKYLIP
jgi:hypothetical protein